MLKTLRCPVRVVWIYRRTQFLALFTTDLDLSIPQIIALYGARWKIEAAFRELKQEIGSQRAQVRNAHAVNNHLNLCLFAMTLTWIYAARLQRTPTRRHAVNGRASFAFSDVRRLIAQAALNEDFDKVCPIPRKPPEKSLLSALLRMVA